MTILSVNDLKCHYVTDDSVVKAVDGVSFDIAEGEILGIVGESGSGKTTIALGIMGLLPENVNFSGEIVYDGKKISGLSGIEMDKYRWKDIAIVFQNGLEVLNPVMKVGLQVAEPMVKHLGISFEEAEKRCIELFKMTGLDPSWMNSYPHQLSGGMRQRALLAMALSCSPKLLILDEVTSALDAFSRKEIRDMLLNLQKEYGYTMIVISHDITFVSAVASKIAVMYMGRIVETGPVRAVITSPRHPYSRGLIHSTPDIFIYKDMWGIPGDVFMGGEIQGCPFSPRCTQKTDICTKSAPLLCDCGNERKIACHRGGIVSLLKAGELRFCYQLPDKKGLQAVDGVSLDVKEGAVL
ncbi:MAG: ABC transporter ATP-binding protein, partial [Methanomicrobium sp.]|nr:ABC transporter ATP-binding protein [Methanomicrobium sp.]